MLILSLNLNGHSAEVYHNPENKRYIGKSVWSFSSETPEGLTIIGCSSKEQALELFQECTEKAFNSIEGK